MSNTAQVPVIDAHSTISKKQQPTTPQWEKGVRVPHEQLFVQVLVAFGGLHGVNQLPRLDEVLLVLGVHVVGLGDEAICRGVSETALSLLLALPLQGCMGRSCRAGETDQGLWVRGNTNIHDNNQLAQLFILLKIQVLDPTSMQGHF